MTRSNLTEPWKLTLDSVPSASQPVHIQTSARIHDEGISVTNNVFITPTKHAIKDNRYVVITKKLYGAIGNPNFPPSYIDEIWKCINLVYEQEHWAAVLVKCGVAEECIQMVIQIMRAAI